MPITRNRVNWTKMTAQLAKSGAALALSGRGEEALDHQLFGAVAGSGEKASADESCPKAVSTGEKDRRRSQTEIEDLEFSQRCGHCEHM